MLTLLLACEADPSATAESEHPDCDPISLGLCADPFPSTYFMREDAESPTGWRIALGATTLPETRQELQPDPSLWNERDGWSPWGPMLAYLPGMSLEGVVGWDDIEASLADDAKIVLLDAETGERQPYWAELDVSGESDPNDTLLMIRPVQPLANGHRFIVALRDIVDGSGNVMAPSRGFEFLRSGEESGDVAIDSRLDRYDDVFASLEATGWARSEVQLAWDFVVGSTEGITGKAVAIRDDALAQVAANGFTYTIDAIDDGGGAGIDESVWAFVYGTFEAPLYCEEDAPGTLLTRGDDGMPYQDGTTRVPFTILIPRTAMTDPRPLPVVQYGHGLLGDQDEINSGYLGEIAERYGWVIFAVNWTGMDEEDAEDIPLMIVQDIGRFGTIPERSQQGFMEFALAAELMAGPLASDANLEFGGVNVIDPAEMYYYGNSQGAILGGAYLALSTRISRGTLGVGGSPYSLLLARSSDFTPFFGLFQSVYPDPRDIGLWMVLMQTLWDSGEAAGYARQMIDEPLSGVPAKSVLLQDAIGDAQVTTLGAQNLGRAYHAGLPTPAFAPVWGLEEVADGTVGSGLAEYDHGAPAVPVTNVPPDDAYDTHEHTRRAWAAQEQMANFFSTGEIANFCQGDQCFCDPDAEGDVCDEPAGE
jgi:hypothetical protein